MGIKQRIIAGSLLSGSIILSALTVQAANLNEVLAVAYMNNPVLEANRAGLRAGDESVNQAKAGWRPSLVGSGSFGYRDVSTDAQFSSTAKTNPKSYGLEVRQNLFNGFQTVNNTQSAKKSVLANRARLLSAEQQVLLDSVTAYMNVIRDEVVVNLRNNNVGVLRRQLEASADRYRVGEITRTDVAQSKARLSRALSDKIRAERDLVSSRASYRRVIGMTPESLELPDHLPPLPASEERAIETAKDYNPNLVEAFYTHESAKSLVKREKGALLPTVDLSASINQSYENFSNSDSSIDKRVVARMTVPLYQSGSVSSRIRQAKQTENQRRLEVIAAERQVDEAVRVAWESYRETKGRIVATTDQVSANKIALDGVRQEAEVGSRTTLDVLDAEQEYLDSQVSLEVARRDNYVAAYSLLSAMGKLTAKDLSLDVTLYDPAQNLDDIENQFYGW